MMNETTKPKANTEVAGHFKLFVMRDKLWVFLRRNHPESEILTKRLMFIRAILYPLDTFYWRYGERNGYSPPI